MANKTNCSPLPIDSNTTTNNNCVLPQAPTSVSSISLSSSPASNESCSCSKIAIMQLFHEMKQDFPTIPDTIVYNYVKNNCHNRFACIEGLRQESKEYPGSVNPYPQALRNQNNNKKTNMHLLRKAPAVPTAVTQTAGISSTTVSNAMTNDKNKENNQSVEQDKTFILQRPTTLNLKSLDSCVRLNNNRPRRMAPPPPLSSTDSISNESTPCEHGSNGLNKTPLNVSLNVIVSPVTGRPPVRPPRNTSNTLNAVETGSSHQHHRSPQASSPRNITSLSFTLHQPNGNSANQHNGIKDTDDANGPSLTYASSSYDAQTGYQSRLEIIVAGNNGNIGSDGDVSSIHSSIRKKSNLPVIETRNEHVQNSGSINQPSRSGSSSIPNVVATPEFLEESDTVHRQLLFKQRLFMELENEKKRLETMQHELKAIQAPLPIGGVRTLSQEIEELQKNCDQMAKEVEEAGPSYALGETNEAFYKTIYTGQRLPVQQMRTTVRPQRPPPPQMPAAFRSNLNQPSTSINSTYLPPLSQQQYPNNRNHTNQLELSTASRSPSTPAPNTSNIDDDGEGEGWTCNMCTFQNHQFLTKCEQCEMPLLSAGNNVSNHGFMPMQMPPHLPPPLNLPPYQQYPPYITQQQPLQSNQFISYQQPTIMHIPYQRQTVTARATNRPPIVVSYANPLPPRLTQQH